jgi:hypothetical protein
LEPSQLCHRELCIRGAPYGRKAYLDAHPLRSSSDAAVAATLAESVLLDAEADTEILQRLQALGYVD